MIRGPQDFPEVRRLLEVADLALASGTLPAGERKTLALERAAVAELLERAEIEADLSAAVARGLSRQSLAYDAERNPREVCLAHFQAEPCRTCAAYVAAGL